MSNDYGGGVQEELFPGARVIHLEVDVLSDLWDDLRSEFAENDWSEEEGLRHILAAGLAYLRAERMRDEVANGADPEPRLEQVLHDWMEMHGRMALLKYRTYQSLQDAKTLALKLNACRQERDALSKTLQNLRDQSEGE